MSSRRHLQHLLTSLRDARGDEDVLAFACVSEHETRVGPGRVSRHLGARRRVWYAAFIPVSSWETAPIDRVRATVPLGSPRLDIDSSAGPAFQSPPAARPDEPPAAL